MEENTKLLVEENTILPSHVSPYIRIFRLFTYQHSFDCPVPFLHLSFERCTLYPVQAFLQENLCIKHDKKDSVLDMNSHDTYLYIVEFTSIVIM